MTLKEMAEKIVPGLLTLVIIGMFTMYIKVEFNSKVIEEAPKIAKKKHKGYEKDIRECREDIIRLQEHEKIYLTREQYYKEKH
jgi:hypothetical protein